MQGATLSPEPPATGLRIGGWEKLSAVDFPGRLAAVVFCQGCAWRCGYCHNPHLLPFVPAAEPAADWPAIRRWLEGRRGLLDAVVFSGGEATLQAGLVSALREARALGFETGLHTGGPVPERLSEVLPHLDWVGFDLKAPFDAYEGVTGQPHGARARESLRRLVGSAVAYEVRTTWHPALLSEAALGAMANALVDEGVGAWVLQRYRPEGSLDPRLARLPVGEPPVEACRRPGLRVEVR